MSNFFDVPRKVAGFHVLVLIKNVLNTPHNGFREAYWAYAVTGNPLGIYVVRKKTIYVVALAM